MWHPVYISLDKGFLSLKKVKYIFVKKLMTKKFLNAEEDLLILRESNIIGRPIKIKYENCFREKNPLALYGKLSSIDNQLLYVYRAKF